MMSVNNASGRQTNALPAACEVHFDEKNTQTITRLIVRVCLAESVD